MSINPSYFCNFRCSFCYLGPALGDRTRISPEALRNRMVEISTYRPIHGIDVYGGEVGLYTPADFDSLKSVISEFFDGQIKVTTNLSVVPTYFHDHDVDLYVSFDGPARQSHATVLRNMRSLNRPFHILMLSGPDLIKCDPDEFISLFNSLELLESVEIKPYSLNQHSDVGVDWCTQEEWLQKWLISGLEKNFLFVNERNIQESLSGIYNAYSDEHLYITPLGQLAVLDFDSADREYFRTVANMSEYLNWCYFEKARVADNPICGRCEFIGHCLTEHLRDVKSIDFSCNGGYQLLKWVQRRQKKQILDMSGRHAHI